MEPSRTYWGLLRRRQCVLPTLRGWLLLSLVVALLALAAFLRTYPFLAMSDPVPGGVLVVEGWLPDYTLQAAITEFGEHPYTKLLVTGIPLEQGAPLSEYTNYANLGAAVLVKLGMSTNQVQAVPTPVIRRDRTYAMALSLKAWLRENQASTTRVNLITQAPHARRSRLLFEKALGHGFTVGVVPVPPRGYDRKDWWRSSQGVRVVIGEAIAYAYARFLFHPPKQGEAMLD